MKTPRGLLLVIIFLGAPRSTRAYTIHLANTEIEKIGTAIWRNESACSYEKLTWWNEGEEFASMGIGHFIWYPRNSHRPFKDTFPELLAFFKRNGVQLPTWLTATSTACPWKNRASFFLHLESTRMKELRTLLASTVPLQTRFIVKRVVNALPTLLKQVNADQQHHIKRQFYYVATTPMGMYAIIDYLNFKGEGINPQENYHGHRWGLLQVLTNMHAHKSGNNALQEFADAAKKVLRERVIHAPAERNEQRWLPGWFNRINTYIA
jgi:hypothetical protein